MILDQRQTYTAHDGRLSFDPADLIDSESRLDLQGLAELLHYRWMFGGRTLIDNVGYQSCWGEDYALTFADCAKRGFKFSMNFMSRFDEFMEDYFCVTHPPKNSFLGISGGIDSTYLLAKIKSLADGDDSVRGINVKAEGYDESAEAQETCDALGVDLRVIEYDPLTTARNAVLELGMPVDRGSTLPVYAMCKHALAADVDLIVGDSADCVFAPSMNSHVKILTQNASPYPSPQSFANQLPHNLGFAPHAPSYPGYGKLQEAMLFDIFEEIPFYYKYRFNQFGRGIRVLLPYQDPMVLAGALQADIHGSWDPVKLPLRQLTEKIMTKQLNISESVAHKLCFRPKKALKVQASAMQSIIDKEFNVQLLHDENAFNRRLFNSPGLVEALPQETKYTLALLCIWLNKVWYPNQ